MLIILILIGLLLLGIVLTVISEKAKINFSIRETFGNIGGMLIVMSSAILIAVIGFGLFFRTPLAIKQNEINYEETYKALTASLNSDKNNLTILADKIADYNSKVKKYYIKAYDPWVSWFNPKLEKEPEYINLEDYLN